MVACFIIFLSLTFQTLRANYKYTHCNHYYDKPIDVCFSSLSPTGLKSFKYICSINTRNTSSIRPNNTILFQTFNNTDACESNALLNTTVIQNLTDPSTYTTVIQNSTDNTTDYAFNPYISCRSTKSCPFFRGRYYITKILTDSPTIDPTQFPSITPTPKPTQNPTVINGTLSPSPSPTNIPTNTPTNIPTFTPTFDMQNNTYSPSIYPTQNPIDWGPYFPNETCARTPLHDYYNEFVYIIDVCMPVYTEPKNTNNTESVWAIGAENEFEHSGIDNQTYVRRTCTADPFGTPVNIQSTLFNNKTCNNSIVMDSNAEIYDNGMCYNTSMDTYMNKDIKHISQNSTRDWYKLLIVECNNVPDSPVIDSEYMFYEFDLISSWITLVLASLMWFLYTVYVLRSCRRVKRKETYNESGIFVLDDNFSESRLSVLVFQWFALFALWLNAVFNFLNSWSVIDLEDGDQCNLMMSALDLTWHWGKGFFYISLMSRIVLIMEGLSDKYIIPAKILKVFAFEIVAYFMLTPILDLVTTRADHRLYEFMDERSSEVLYVCGESIEYWISFLLLLGDLLLCSTTIGVYLYALGEMIMEPIQNQKLIDLVIRYAIFSVFGAVFIMIGNGVWATNNISTARYIDCIFIIFSIMLMLSLCTSCYLQCCSNCHKKHRNTYIKHFLKAKKNFITKEFKEIENNPKYIIKSYDRSFDAKLTQILSKKNLKANASMDRYHHNTKLHDINSNIKSRKKQKKAKKKLRRQFSTLNKAATVRLDNREIETMERLLSFKSSRKLRKYDDENESKYSMGNNSYSVPLSDKGSENLSDIDEDGGIMVKRRLRKKKTKTHGLLAVLDPTESNLPTSLTIAIHSTVVETVKADEDAHLQELKKTDAYKIHKTMDDLWTKVDTYWDENQILFPRRSPTIYPGTAYKLSNKDKFALNQRTEEHSNSEDHSESADSDDDEQVFDIEQKWPKNSRKYGNTKNLDHIYHILKDLDEKELLKIWEFFDKEHKKRIDYKDTLVKLLGAFFLLYFRKKIFGKQQSKQEEQKEDMNYISLDEQPPRFDELEPLLRVLAKYIRDYLRHKKKKFIKKTDYLKNIKKYLKLAIEQRNRLMERRNNKLTKKSALTDFVSASIKTDTDYKEEDSAEIDAMLLQLGQMNNDHRIGDIKEEESPLVKTRSDEEVEIELQRRMDNYVPRQSANKYALPSVSQITTVEPRMRIDVEIEKLREKQKSHRQLYGGGKKRHSSSSHLTKLTSLLLDEETQIALASIQDDVPTTVDQTSLNVMDEDMGIDVDDINLEQPKITSDHSETLSFDVNALMDEFDAMEMFTPQTAGTTPSVNIETFSEQKAHVKDTAGTEIINLNAVEPRKSKVVVIDNSLIKDEATVESELETETENASVELVEMKDNVSEHKQSDTVVELKDSVSRSKKSLKDNQSNNKYLKDHISLQDNASKLSTPSGHMPLEQGISSIESAKGGQNSLEIDQQMMDDVLDVTFAVDDSDEED